MGRGVPCRERGVAVAGLTKVTVENLTDEQIDRFAQRATDPADIANAKAAGRGRRTRTQHDPRRAARQYIANALNTEVSNG